MTTQENVLKKLMSEPGIYIAIYDELSFSDMFKVVTPYVDHEGLCKWLVLFDYNSLGHITRNRNTAGLSEDELFEKLSIIHHDYNDTNTVLYPHNKSLLEDTSSLQSLIDSHVKKESENHYRYRPSSFAINPRYLRKYSRIHSLDALDHHFNEYDKVANANNIKPMHPISRQLILDELREHVLPYLQQPVPIQRLPDVAL